MRIPVDCFILGRLLYGRLPDCKDGVRALKQEAGLQHLRA